MGKLLMMMIMSKEETFFFFKKKIDKANTLRLVRLFTKF